MLKAKKRRYKMFNEALNLLQNEYHKSLEIVGSSEFHKKWADEKMRHTMQVVGAGNYIIPRVAWLKEKSAEYVETVKTAVLLHDVCRFSEIVRLYNGQKGFDHGVGGAEFLRAHKDFNDIRIWLPIKHHGHLIDALYEDDDFKRINDKKLRDEVERICFIVRDADKIANLRMLAYEKDMRPLFFGKMTEDFATDGKVSGIIKEAAFSGRTTPRFPDSTVADKMVGYLSWYFDINYQYAVDFCDKLSVTPRLLQIFGDMCADKEFAEKFTAYFKQFLAQHAYLR
jgi:hypothetical protein